MEILQRIKSLIELKGYNVNSFSKKIGIAQVTLNNYFRLNRLPAYETLHAILHTFPDVSAEWLMRGEGDMFICDGMPVIRGDESESEEDLHVALAQCRAKLEDSQNENVKLLGQLEFMEELRNRELADVPVAKEATPYGKTISPALEEKRAFDFDKAPSAPTTEEKADALIEEIGQRIEESLSTPSLGELVQQEMSAPASPAKEEKFNNTGSISCENTCEF